MAVPADRIRKYCEAAKLDRFGRRAGNFALHKMNRLVGIVGQIADCLCT